MARAKKTDAGNASKSRAAKPASDETAVDQDAIETTAGSPDEIVTPSEDAEASAEAPAESQPEAEAGAAAEETHGPDTEPQTGGDAEPDVEKPAAEASGAQSTGDSAAQEPPPPPPHAPPPQKPSGGGFLPGLLGGILAVAAIGASLWALNPGLLDTLRGGETVSLEPLEEAVADQSDRSTALEQQLAGLRDEIAALRETAPDGQADSAQMAELEARVIERVDTLSAALETVSSTITQLDGRVAEIEARPPAVAEGNTAAATAQVVAEMRRALEEQRVEIAALAEEAQARIGAAEAEAVRLREEAEAAADAAVGRAALSRLRAAMDAGGPFGDVLSDISSVTEAEIPEALVNVADTGVPTLAELQSSFPGAAREALSASLQSGIDPEDNAMDRIGAFLRAQTGARSTVPREGDDPDAVLSRAEAAVAQGDLSAALDLIGQLPEPGQQAMADWRSRAGSRVSALEAADTLAAAFASN